MSEKLSKKLVCFRMINPSLKEFLLLSFFSLLYGAVVFHIGNKSWNVGSSPLGANPSLKHWPSAESRRPGCWVLDRSRISKISSLFDFQCKINGFRSNFFSDFWTLLTNFGEKQQYTVRHFVRSTACLKNTKNRQKRRKRYEKRQKGIKSNK